jgi:hypothetical protein
MDWDRSALASLREILANLFPTSTDARRIATDAGLNPTRIEFEGKPSTIGLTFLSTPGASLAKLIILLKRPLRNFPTMTHSEALKVERLLRYCKDQRPAIGAAQSAPLS